MLWEKGVLKDLGVLKVGGVSTAFAVNDRGQVVGNSTYPDNINPKDIRAFLWQAEKLYDLNALLPPASNVFLREARSINNKGQIVAGGTFKGGERSFLLTPRSNR